MSKNQINKYVWLVETLYHAKKITLKEINRRWLDTDLSEGLEIPRRTFHTWKNAVEDMFGLVIMCDKSDGDRYYIENREVLEDDGLQRWLLSTMSVNNTLLENKSLSDRILLESIPSGQDFLATVMEAMKKNRLLEITYKGFWSESEHTFPVAPYCVKLFRQRWYLLADNGERMAIYALDRMQSVVLTDQHFNRPIDFSPEAYFAEYFGVMTDGTPLEHVVLRAYGKMANLLRTLPLHASQRELERGEDYTDFALDIRPSIDFVSELLSKTDGLDVLEPQSLKEKIRQILEDALRRNP